MAPKAGEEGRPAADGDLQLDVVGTGLNADGNATFDYRAECTFRGQ